MTAQNDPHLDLLDLTTTSAPKELITRAFRQAWNKNKQKTIQLIFYIRDIQSGLGRRDASYVLMKEVKRYAPRTYMGNLIYFCEKYGSFRDIFGLVEDGVDSLMELCYMKRTLEEDLIALQDGKYISLAGKWAPSEGGKYDIFAKKLAALLFPGSSEPMKRYRKEVLTPLRSSIGIIESKICGKDWGVIDYEKAPNHAKRKYKKMFLRQGGECKGYVNVAVQTDNTGNRLDDMLMPYDYIYIDDSDKDLMI